VAVAVVVAIVVHKMVVTELLLMPVAQTLAVLLAAQAEVELLVMVVVAAGADISAQALPALNLHRAEVILTPGVQATAVVVEAVLHRRTTVLIMRAITTAWAMIKVASVAVVVVNGAAKVVLAPVEDILAELETVLRAE
jgi:hypothetical protein